MSKARVVLLEGTWWKSHEVPLILPYFHALAISHREIDLCHRTIRCVEDIDYYVGKISKNAGALLYFACHGEELHLKPAGERDKISQDELLAALSSAKEGAVSFVHFGCCEMIDPDDRRKTHDGILDASGAKWSSGYTKEVDWLQSTLLDLALVAEVFIPQCASTDGRKTRPKALATDFISTYEQLARDLGFSAFSKVTGGAQLFPQRLR